MAITGVQGFFYDGLCKNFNFSMSPQIRQPAKIHI